MAGSSEGEVNLWPAFVDVLTATIMVVTFLLVIMSAAVMTLSQRMVTEMRAHFEREAAMKVAAAELAKVRTDGARDGLTPPGLTPGSLETDTPVDGEEALVARSRDIPETKRLAVAAPSDEKAKPKTGSTVRSADALFAVDFEPRALAFTAAAEDAAMKIIAEAALKPADKLEIWSIVPSDSSVSGAERIAYYRALATRNVLIKAGISPANISAQIKVTDEPGAAHVVSVLLKPE